jgi:Holliday junction DNA helicase RuvB
MTIQQDRVISTATQRDEEVYDRAVRPKTLADYIGQPAMKAQMEIFIQAARMRAESLDHVLIFGATGSSARPRSPTSSQMSSVSASSRRPARSSSGPATSPRC